MIAVNVNGGTNAGRRIIRKPASDWVHECAYWTIDRSRHVPGGVLLEAAVTRCPACGCKRR